MSVVNSVTAPAVNFTYSPSVGGSPSIPMDSDGILLFCQNQLEHLDDSIGKAMQAQQKAVDLQSTISGLSKNITGGVLSNPSDPAFINADGTPKTAFDPNDSQGAITNQGALDNMKKQLTDEAATLEASGDPNDKTAATKLRAAADQLQSLMDNGKNGNGLPSVTTDELKQVGASIDDITTGLRSQGEMSMLDLQSLVQQRSTMLTETTNVMQGIAQPTQTIAGNMKVA